MRSYELTLAAEEDLRGIWRYTQETWGLDHAETYFDRIEACCEAVGDGRARSKTLSGLPDSIHIYRCEHHYLVFLNESRPVIIAILHERMDFMRRLKDRL
ncbi:type II toxin-antitoxin system RelE/ParE family toxin [Fulvimarina endophytica]|uniref:Type II toxin-antitoxin system RelE/ParE family toxin n=1 Tax=Fulvimarina endophytica TaxID=2293836 RepID=A0A371WXY6_9HYPH|nr:type II toxin-antitoxin system RelE/ParE family toxin [Fulvimarina endophytica]RFC61843.1 type II toxin-antitoxin system RelE/ParE family toxin [Fulvimarina endophytica]